MSFGAAMMGHINQSWLLGNVPLQLALRTFLGDLSLEIPKVFGSL